MKKITFILGLALLGSGLTFAQTAEERAQIIKDYDLERLQDLRVDFEQQFEIRMERATRLAEENGWPLRKELSDGSFGSLYDVVNGEPVYISNHNRIAGIMQGANQLWNGGSLGLNVEGQNMTVGVWDGDTNSGDVNENHEALVGRVTFGEVGIPSSDIQNDSHATHVTGTIIASGPDTAATGIAPQANAIFYNFGNDNSEMTGEAASGLLVSNHSYGIPANGGISVNQLGKYTGSAASVDQIVYNAPFYLPVYSAGNSRNTGANAADGGYDLLTGDKLAKNSLVVGASIGNPSYSGPASVPMSSFSSWGPADDGRVKPDITTKGVGMYSSDYTGSNSSYTVKQGTSMSSPAVSGGLILLQQYYNQLNNQYMKAATLKGLALHTVREAGNNDGPDYQFGWGLLDTEAAAVAIRDNGNDALIEERSLAFGTNYTTSFPATTSSKLIVSLSWTDFPGSANTGGNDNTSPALRNNLDVVVTDSNGNTFYSWKLDPANFSAAATNNSLNDVDNFEKVEIDNPNGTYTVTVSHRGIIFANIQDYSLIITGADQGTFSNGDNNLETFSLFPNPASDHFTIAFNNQLSGDKIDVVLYDVLGQEVMSKSFDNNGVFQQRISTATLDSGIYLVRVGNGVTASTRKLIVR